MKNNSKAYAKALAEVILKGIKPGQEQKVVDNFSKFLLKTGKQAKAKEIVAMAEDIVLAKKGNRKITFETARKMAQSQKKMLESFAKEGDVIYEKINPEIIAGVKIIINGAKQFDASLQAKLQNIFK